MHASQNGHAEIVKALLKRGAKADAKTVDGWTALMSAAQDGHAETVEALRKHGAE